MRRNARFLLELAKGRRPRLLGLVDPALRHLPGLVGVIDPCADEHLALAVEEHHADAAAIPAIVAHRARSTHGLRCARQRAKSPFDEGTAFLKFMKPWTVPGASQ